MNKWLTLLLLSLMITTAHADAKRGKSLHDNNCMSCHIGIMGGLGDDMYLRDNRRVDSYQRLVKQVNRCNDNLDVPWHDDEVMDVVEYLNLQYYHFGEGL